MSEQIEWDLEFGGNLLRLKRNAPANVREYLDYNGSRIDAYDAWFVEGWGDYEQAADIERWVDDLGPMIVPSLGGLTQEQLAEVVKQGFMGHPAPVRVS